MHKFHLPWERERMNEEELVEMAKYMSELRIMVRSLELENEIDLDKMVDFEKLTNYFFNEKRYSYGKPIKAGKKGFKYL